MISSIPSSLPDVEPMTAIEVRRWLGLVPEGQLDVIAHRTKVSMSALQSARSDGDVALSRAAEMRIRIYFERSIAITRCCYVPDRQVTA